MNFPVLYQCPNIHQTSILPSDYPPDFYYPDHQSSRRLPSHTNPGTKNAELMLLKNVLITILTLSFSFLFRTFWVLLSYASGLQTLRRLNKSLSFISNQRLLPLHPENNWKIKWKFQAELEMNFGTQHICKFSISSKIWGKPGGVCTVTKSLEELVLEVEIGVYP